MTLSDSDRDDARAALAPTLEATAAILPLLARPRNPRFPAKAAAHWNQAWADVQAAWSDRNGGGLAALRPAVFALSAAALALQDVDCLALSEAVASATDRLDEPAGLGNSRLVTAISAAVECFAVVDALEHEAFPQRARHFASRLERVAKEREAPARSPVLDRLFAEEGHECLEKMRLACAALPRTPWRSNALPPIWPGSPMPLIWETLPSPRADWFAPCLCAPENGWTWRQRNPGTWSWA